MNNSQTSVSQVNSESESTAARKGAMQAAPITREQPSARMVKRGDTRRKLEDLMLAKESQDLW
ncbi:MAG: hypothetical protein JO142_05655 [Burkholderiales bacterium]|nr:hypothetical protein [Burkholderiales bacterium]